MASLALAAVAAPASATADVTISSSGPLTAITISNDLGCQVSHAADTSFEFFPPASSPGQCGTYLSLAGALYAPASSAGTVTGTAFTAVSQSPVTGSGTAGDPFKVVTEVAAGSSGVSIVQTDSYVVGQESYRTDVRLVGNQGGGPFVLYSAADCYLQNSDRGFGAVNLAGATVACRGATADPNAPAPGDRIEGWTALTPGATYLEAGFADVWAAIRSQQPLNNTCRCDEFIDNGAGLSWNGTLAQGGQATYSHTTLLSPTAASSAPAGPPEAGKSVVVDIVTGTVFVKVPAGHAASGAGLARSAQAPAGFVALKGTENIPLGSTLDTRQGTIGLTSAADLAGRTQRAQFHAGVFEVRQKKEAKPTTEIRLASASFLSYANSCAAQVSGVRGSAAKSKKRVGRLFGSGKGRFRTRGRFSAATVKGTIWLTEDRCNGTLTQVTKGKVAVFDFGLNKRVTVRSGHSYLARATRAAIRKLGTK